MCSTMVSVELSPSRSPTPLPSGACGSVRPDGPGSGTNASSMAVATSPWVQSTADSPAIRRISRRAASTPLPLGQFVDRLDRRCRGPRPAGCTVSTAPHKGAAQDPMRAGTGSGAGHRAAARARPLGDSGRRRSSPLYGTPSSRVRVADHQQRPCHDAVMPGDGSRRCRLAAPPSERSAHLDQCPSRGTSTPGCSGNGKVSSSRPCLASEWYLRSANHHRRESKRYRSW